MGRNSFYILSFGFTFSTLNFKFSSTVVEESLQIRLFMQNKAKFQKVKLNVNRLLTKDYVQMDTWSIRKKQSQTNPNKAKSCPPSVWRIKAKMNVTSIITKDYENKPPIRAPKKQSQTLKRQKPMQISLPKGIMKQTALSASGKTKPNKPKQTQCLPATPFGGLARHAVWRACPPCRLEGLPAISVAGHPGFGIRFCKNPADLLSHVTRNVERQNMNKRDLLKSLVLTTASAMKKFHLILVLHRRILFNSASNCEMEKGGNFAKEGKIAARQPHKLTFLDPLEALTRLR